MPLSGVKSTGDKTSGKYLFLETIFNRPTAFESYYYEAADWYSHIYQYKTFRKEFWTSDYNYYVVILI